MPPPFLTGCTMSQAPSFSDTFVYIDKHINIYKSLIGLIRRHEKGNSRKLLIDAKSIFDNNNHLSICITDDDNC